MGRGSYIGGSTTIKVFGRTSKPNSKKRRLTGRTKHISRPHVELLLNKISHYKKENDTNFMYKNAIIICQKLSGQRKTQKNQKYINDTFSKLNDLDIDMNILKRKIKESLKNKISKRYKKNSQNI